MNSQIKFLRRVRIHGGECGAVARALHHEAKTLSLPAVIGNVSITTTERKIMSKRTFFKRMALGVIAALGFGLLSTPTAQAVLLTNSLTLSSATAETTINDTATVNATIRFSGSVGNTSNADSVTLRYTCDVSGAVAGTTCPALSGYQDQLADTFNVQLKMGTFIGAWQNISSAGWTESLHTASSSARSVVPLKGTFSTVGTYTYSFYMNKNGTVSGTSDLLNTSASGTVYTTWTVTVTSPSLNATGGSANVYISSDTATAQNGRLSMLTATDSAIVASRGSASDPGLVGYAYVVVKNAAGDTNVLVATSRFPVEDSVTVTVGGPGLIRAGGMGSNPAKSAVLNVSNRSVFNTTETLAIYNDGTAGTMTLTFSKGSTTLATKTVTFYGPPASVVANLSDTYTSLAGTVTLSGQVKDSGGNVLSTGTVYVFSSDTKIAGSVPTTAVFGQTGHRCETFTGTSSATYRLSCGITLTDTGVVTLTVGDSWTVAGSSWTSTGVELTITGNTVASATVAFDKATYAPGERAVITITTKDIAGRLSANGASGALAAAFSNYTLTGSTSLPYRGTNSSSSDVTYSTSLTRYMDTGVETRVVTMPTIGADVTYTIHVPGFGVGSNPTPVTATAKVVDPNATAIAGSTAAAEAATDAAAEAIDAANAATDAANLAAEAADAATVAAEEARDAADAATAAVEELATQVATLMAALKAQITTLANTVAKIAKKVKA
jgi:trimeric autotransporter adhesin